MICKFCANNLDFDQSAMYAFDARILKTYAYIYYKCNNCINKPKFFYKIMYLYDNLYNKLDSITFFEKSILVTLNYKFNKTSILFMNNFPSLDFNFVADITPNNFESEIVRLKNLNIFS